MDWWKKKKSRSAGEILLEELIECCDGKSNPIKFFSADEIIKATDNFCNHVSQLFGFERWYSVTLDNHRTILLKKLWRAQSVYPRDFYPKARDIAISSMVSGHKNFMKLVGCCLRPKLHIWPFVYSNMDLRNIVQDENGVSKLSDFSYCVSIPEGETHVKLGYVREGYNYKYDDYKISHVVSEKTDAFGFGILMQKLLTGEERHREIHGRKDRKTLARKFSRWLSKSIGERLIDDIVDPKILEEMGEVAKNERFRMEAFLVLSEKCIGLRGEVPKMVQVAKELKRFL
ncbi:hypothetical protein N665_0322s0003 [Sinapis alba]|nr:hypothetical protein N665_0322s0003 [Sinapis alba]